MTIIQDAPADLQANDRIGCPPWCAGRRDTHPGDEGIVIHRRPVGGLGVTVEYLAEDDEAPVVNAPLVNGDGDLTPAEARELAADLIAAASVLDSAVSA